LEVHVQKDPSIATPET
jgi:hypothetical protein